MHVYSIEGHKRETVVFFFAVLDVVTTALLAYNGVIEFMNKGLICRFLGIEETHYVYQLFLCCGQALVPVTIYAVLSFLYNRYIWKWKLLYLWHGIPDLNGHWIGTVKSPLKKNESSINADIKQTWTKIQVNTRSASGSAALSETAMIQLERNGVFFRYSFFTTREKEHGYIGYNKLKCSVSELSGEYFTNKGLPDDADKGKGSKGTITLRKVTRK